MGARWSTFFVAMTAYILGIVAVSWMLHARTGVLPSPAAIFLFVLLAVPGFASQLSRDPE